MNARRVWLGIAFLAFLGCGVAADMVYRHRGGHSSWPAWLVAAGLLCIIGLHGIARAERSKTVPVVDSADERNRKGAQNLAEWLELAYGFGVTRDGERNACPLCRGVAAVTEADKWAVLANPRASRYHVLHMTGCPLREATRLAKYTASGGEDPDGFQQGRDVDVSLRSPFHDHGLDFRSMTRLEGWECRFCGNGFACLNAEVEKYVDPDVVDRNVDAVRKTGNVFVICSSCWDITTTTLKALPAIIPELRP